MQNETLNAERTPRNFIFYPKRTKSEQREIQPGGITKWVHHRDFTPSAKRK